MPATYLCVLWLYILSALLPQGPGVGLTLSCSTSAAFPVSSSSTPLAWNRHLPPLVLACLFFLLLIR